jgi:hypothetical protein
MSSATPATFAFLTNPELIAINQDISPAATLRQATPSSLQSSAGVAVSLQACDSAAFAQQWVPGGAAGAIQSKYGALCVAANASGAVAAAPCDGSAAQAWGIRNNSTLVVVGAGAATGACLAGDGDDGAVSVAPCTYAGPTAPPPLFASFGEQVWLWDARQNIIHGASGLCLALGLANNPASGAWVTNNGTLQHEIWAGTLSSGKTVAVLFNKGPAADTLTAAWDALGLARGTTLPVRDVLARADLPPATGLSADVAAHGVAVFVVG